MTNLNAVQKGGIGQWCPSLERSQVKDQGWWKLTEFNDVEASVIIYSNVELEC